MSLATVTDINLQRSLSGRLFGYGELVVEAAGQDQALATVQFVPFPVQVYNEILPASRRAGSNQALSHAHA